jgi:hypothetical protein
LATSSGLPRRLTGERLSRSLTQFTKLRADRAKIVLHQSGEKILFYAAIWYMHAF